MSIFSRLTHLTTGGKSFPKVLFSTPNLILGRVRKLIKVTVQTREKGEIIRTSEEDTYTAALACLGTGSVV